MPGSAEPLDPLERLAQRVPPFWRRVTASQLFLAGFLALILFGTVSLLVLPGLYTGDRLSFIDALFTATSAVCVTGLVVVDTATYFTGWGQAVILGLIQLGGLGILSFTTFIILLLGGRMTLRGEAVVAATEDVSRVDAVHLLRSIFGYTFLIEAVGASLLWFGWFDEFGSLGAVWPALFHAVSAFCNAGFSIFSGSLQAFADDASTLTVIAVLVALGGLGFLVLEELHDWARGWGRHRLSLHARLVLLTSAILIVGGAALFVLFEWNNLLAARAGPFAAVMDALFLSIVPRTAGFNIVDYSELTSASLLLTMLLMFVGGSPGSTAGGIKTTTAALLVGAAIARVRGRAVTDAFRRTVPEGTSQRATGLAVLAMALLGAAILLLQVTELGGVPFPTSEGRFFALTFEAVSAFGTVGLSLGATADLSLTGKVIVVVLMFIGRVGPLTLVASMAVAAQRRRASFRYASEDVMVG